jgi:hypothetical protein
MSTNILFLASNNVLACSNLGQHILALDGDQEVFDGVFHPLFQDKGSWGKKSQKCSLDLESPIHKHLKIDLDCE